jgi:signal transduction histidine kinase/ActR/RegA family two-component response regulator
MTAHDTLNRPARQQFSLRLILIAPFILQLFAAVGLTGYLSMRNGQQAVDKLAQQLQDEIGNRIDQHLDSYLEVPKQINRQNDTLFRTGLLDPLDFETVGKHFWHQVSLYNVNYIQFGTTNGEYIGAGDYGDRQVKIEEIPLGKPGTTFQYAVNTVGDRTKLLEQGEFEPRNEPWYTVPKDTQKPAWGTVYNWETNPEILSVPAGYPVFNKAGQFIGSMGIDLNLAKVSDFLRDLKIGQTGKAFIMERSGTLVATSAPEKPFRMNGESAERVLATDSQDANIKQSALYLKQNLPDLAQLQQSRFFSVDVNGQRQYLKVLPWKDDLGLDWLVVLLIPESDFMAQIHANNRLTILLCLASLVGATVVGIYTSRWVTKPILKLGRASEAIAQGQLDQQVETSSVKELGVLGQAFNQMATQLKSSFEDLEHRVEERTLELKQAKQVADFANQAKSDFLASMSHELRTPLNGILGYAQVLGRSQVIPEKELHGVDVIHQCGSHLLNLINDILDLSKIEARKLDLDPQPVHFPSFLQSVVEICQVRAEAKGIEFDYQPDANLPSGVKIDEKRLRQVLLNLIGNAVKFTDRGTVTLRVEQIIASDTEPTWRFTVTDTGVGIAVDQVQNLFQAFEQVGEQQRKSEGTGLGLTISQQLVQLMGGAIQVKSQLGVGSDFFFEVQLPLAQDWMESRAIAIKQIKGYQRNDGITTPYSILIVDDRWENLGVLMQLLEPLGFIMFEAEQGQQALDILHQHPVDLIITDLAMPVMDGFELLQQIRQSEAWRDYKVIVSSASVAQLDQRMALNAGGDEFLAKPVQADLLFHILGKQLDLTWHYHEMTGGIEKRADTAMIVPSVDVLHQLLELIEIGLLNDVTEVVTQLEQSNGCYQAFAQVVNQLSQQFQTEKLEALIRQSISASFEAEITR